MSAQSRLANFLAAHDDAEGYVDPGMRSRLLYRSDATRVVVLMHGLTASPRSWKDFAHELRDAGVTVVVPRLPLHGHKERMTDALLELTETQLHDFTDALLDAMLALGRPITFVGHSLGGTLTLALAQRRAELERAIAVAPFLGIAQFPHQLHKPAFTVVRRLPNFFLFWNPIDREKLKPEWGYPRYTSHALAVGIAIADSLRADASQRAHAAEHVDLVINRSESSVNNRTVVELARRWRTHPESRVSLHHLSGLPRSHDVIEPQRRRPTASRVLPILRRLILEPLPQSERRVHRI